MLSANTQIFVHDKSNYTSKLIKGKLSNLQILLKYLTGTVTSVFKGGAGACGSRFPPSGGTGSHGCHTSAFPVIILILKCFSF